MLYHRFIAKFVVDLAIFFLVVVVHVDEISDEDPQNKFG